MKILDLEAFGFRGVAERRLSFRDAQGAPAPLMVVTGPPAAGLSSTLEAIAVSAGRLGSVGGLPDLDRVLAPGESTARLRSRWLLDEEESTLGGVDEPETDAEVVFRRGGLCDVDADPGLLAAMSRYGHAPALAKVVWFPALRVSDVISLAMGDFEAEQRRLRLDPSADRFGGLARALAQLAFAALGGGGGDAFARVQSLFGDLSPSVKLVGVSSSAQPEFLLRSGGRLTLARLSMSERNAFVLAASVVLMGLERSVILLDSPEVGLPPGLAARWLDALRGVAPEAQWIVASRDEAVVSRVPREARIELELGT